MDSRKNPAWLKGKKVAIVTDWLTTYGGAEKVVKAVSDMFPEAPIFTSQYSEREVDWFRGKDVKTGWLNLFPAKLRKILSVLRILYFSRLKLDDFNVVISICCAESKGIKTTKDQLHISYLQGPPVQYYWRMYDDYVQNPGFGKLNGVVRFFFKLLARPLRHNDFQAAQHPDVLLANSSYSAAEIDKYYNRKSIVIFPPVEIDKFKPNKRGEGYFISTSRQVNWKRLDIVVDAFRQTNRELLLVGGGAEHQKLVTLADGCENITFIDTIKNPQELSAVVAKARGFVFPSLEPFGIAPIEALSAGVPVLAYKRGGALDYIRDGENGVFFDKQTASSLIKALNKFEKINFDKKAISLSADQFSTDNFNTKFEQIVKEKFNEKF